MIQGLVLVAYRMLVWSGVQTMVSMTSFLVYYQPTGYLNTVQYQEYTADILTLQNEHGNKYVHY